MLGSIFSAIGTNSAAKKIASSARQASAQSAEGQRLARKDLSDSSTSARRVLDSAFNNASGYWEPVLDGSDVRQQAILYENGLADRPQGYEGIQSTPGFDFLESEGRRSILNRASAMGGLNSGSVLKELSRFQTGLDSQNYQAGYNRLAGLVNRDTQARGALSNLNTNLGNNVANVYMQQGVNSANTRIGQANALADGTIRSGNALAQGRQALFNLPQNMLNENLQVAGTAAEIFGNVAGGASSFAALSDERDKADVEPVSVGIDFIMDLEPVTFTYDVRQGDNPMDGPVSGFMAQSLQEIQSEHGVDLGLVNDSDDQRLTVNYASMIPVLVGAVQELTHKIKELESA
jgi:hypothetical protein